ncbi:MULTISPECIES: hypothetical protein [Protofrankia]|uniref:hypothetical protein n=1 Tax=Protofrankia TaxID=2994361 RepID=UPI001872C11B|nr:MULTISPECIES: hypothetical protein [Protofrankia]
MSPSPVQIDLVDEVFLAVDPAVASAAVHDPAWWRVLWPDLELTVFQDRGAEGLRFTVTGALVGTSEIWLEPWGDGVVAHVFLRADVTRRGRPAEVRRLRPRAAARWAQHRSLHTKRQLNVLKDVLEAGRAPGEPAAAPPPQPAASTGPAPAGPAPAGPAPAGPAVGPVEPTGRPERFAEPAVRSAEPAESVAPTAELVESAEPVMRAVKPAEPVGPAVPRAPSADSPGRPVHR